MNIKAMIAIRNEEIWRMKTVQKMRRKSIAAYHNLSDSRVKSILAEMKIKKMGCVQPENKVVDSLSGMN